jgi:hypothetical protein
MTFRSLEYNERNVLVHGRPTSRDSWFPGYAWRIVSCARCYSHLGWKFKLVMRSGDAADADVDIDADASPSSPSSGHGGGATAGDVDIDAAGETTAAVGLVGSIFEAGTTNVALIDVEENEEDLVSVNDDDDDDDDDDDGIDDDDDDEDGLSYNTADAEMDQEDTENQEEDLDESVPRVVRRAVVFW